MTEQQSPMSAGSSYRPRSADTDVPGAGRMGGWVTFAGVVMAVVGCFAIFEGFVALVAPTTFVATAAGVLVLNFTAWGWLHIILGALLLVTGLALVGAAPGWARALGIIVVAINMIVQLAFLPSYPIWSIIVIVLDMIILYALMVSWVPEDAR